MSARLRECRVRVLYSYFSGKRHKPETIDPVLEKALTLFPTVTRRTVKSYARAVLKMLNEETEK